jgi:cation-transporting ATPase E
VTELTGLTRADVEDRRNRGLLNTMPDETGRSLRSILRVNVFTLFNTIVGGCFVLLLVLGAWQDALFGFFLIANMLIGVVQEFQAKRTLARLTVLNAPLARVRRDGLDLECAVTDVVLDDVLVLRPGDQLSADAAVIIGQELEVDESLLTGEADPVRVGVGRELLSGSTVLSGHGFARVIRVGADSYAARITAEARQFALVNSELRDSIARVIRWISIALVPVGAIVVNGQMQAVGGWATAISRGTWRDAAVASVGSLIAMVPQGLVFMTSVALAVGAVRLARKRVLVHELAAVEVLARVDMLCVDKTGTLTEGPLVLERIEPVEHPARGWEQALAWFATEPSANSTARAVGVALEIDGLPGVTPDATVGFSSLHKWGAAHFADATLRGSWVLGGADVVLNGSREHEAPVLERAASLASAGRRTLVLAHSPLRIQPGTEAGEPLLPGELTLVASIVLQERIRRDAAETIAYFARQGVEVCVLSGDDPRTVAAIAHEVGIPGGHSGVDARLLPQDQRALADVVRSERIFGRVTPEQKKALVGAFQSLGHTVAMTGDGVNDALALKRADLGIAMGSGSAAACAVADLILLDGAFTRLPGVVAEGRQVIANVERLAKLFLSKTVYAILLGLLFGTLLWPYPFLPRQLSVVDGLTIGLPALVLALLPNARLYRPGFLGRAARFCIPSGVIAAGTLLAVVAFAYLGGGAMASEVQTISVITLTVTGLWVLFVLLRPLTLTTSAILVGAVAGLLIVLSVPLATDFLGFDLPPAELLVVGLGAALVAGVVLEIVQRSIHR